MKEGDHWMETSGPPLVWIREKVAEEGVGGGSILIAFKTSQIRHEKINDQDNV